MGVFSCWLLADFAVLYAEFSFESWGADQLSAELGVLFLAANLVLIPGSLILCRHRRRAKWIREEADRWLAQGTPGFSPKSRSRRRPFRRILWTPAIVVFLIFLFFPESWGLASHCYEDRSVTVDGNRTSVPLTWAIARNDRSPQFVDAIISKGIARSGFISYFRKEQPIAWVFLGSVVHDQHAQGFDARYFRLIASRKVAFGNDVLKCDDVASRFSASDASAPADIRCRGEITTISASFVGSRELSHEFYAVLDAATNVSH
jgi:hypothetical protein